MTGTVVITGGGRGLGLAITRTLLAKGYNVIVVSRTETKELRELASAKLAFIAYDFNEIEKIHELSKCLISLSLEKFNSVIYALINNAAVGDDGVLGTMHESDIARVVTVNVQAPILLTKYLSRHMMLKLVRGRIVNIGSIIATTGYSGLSVYGSTKAAMEGFSRSLAREVGKRGITVNVVAPGFMETDMTSVLGESNLERIRRRSALGEFASTQSVAEMVQYLIGPSSESITGAVFTVDGGSTA